jgi:hypothetical protein
MALGWSSDFSYRYFVRILKASKRLYELHQFHEATEILDLASDCPKLLLRHDIDIDLGGALRIGEIEHEYEVPSTFMVMLRSPFYSADEPSSRSILSSLLAMGHEIGLHFDFGEGQRQSKCDLTSLESWIDSDCSRLEDIVRSPVRSVSFHRPAVEYLRGPLYIAGRVNAYARQLMAWYLSDSRGVWREGEPLPRLLNPEGSLLQLLMHPIWWGLEHMLPEDRLQAFFERSTQGYSVEESRALDSAFVKHVGMNRRGARGS